MKPVNMLMQSLYMLQLIEESCNGDFEENRFRKIMTVGDCIEAQNHAKIWERAAKAC